MHDQVADNQRRSVLITGAFVLFVTVVLGVVLAVAGLDLLGVLLALLVAGGLAAFAWQRSDAVVLRVSRAEPADPIRHARLHNLVEGVCVSTGLTPPSIHVIDDAAPNALVTGRGPQHAAIAVTTGLLDRLDRMELEAVVAHQLDRIRSGGVRPATLAVTLAGGPVLVADLLVRRRWWNGGRAGHDEDRTGGSAPWLGSVGVGLLALSPVLAAPLRAAVGRRDEHLADLSAVGITRYPPGLASALEALAAERTVVHAGTRATAHLWLADPLARTEDEGALAHRNAAFGARPALRARAEVLREL